MEGDLDRGTLVEGFSLTFSSAPSSLAICARILRICGADGWASCRGWG